MKNMILIMWMALLLIGALTQSTDADPADSHRKASVVVTNAAELTAAVANAIGGGPSEIILADGEYILDQLLWIDADDVTVRSQSGNRDAVVIRGRGMDGNTTHIFDVGGRNFTCRNMTLRDVSNHAIQIHGELDADGAVIQNLHILDAREQLIKVSYDSVNAPTIGGDNGVVEDCLLEYSAGIGPQWYIGGVDAHFAKNWIVRDNTFRYIRSPADDVAEHAIHFWSDSENTLVERNVIINCDRGIGFGMGDRGHIGGIIRNNMIYHDASEGFADVSIGLERAPGAQIYNNTIYQEHAYPNAIEYRWPETTGVLIANNSTNAAISARDGASANVSANVTRALASWFVNASAGDLHLAYQEPLVVDQGQPVVGLADDFDLDARSGAVDIGADELQSEEQNAPSAPVLTIDIDGLNVTFSWPPVANADSYMFYYVSFPDGGLAGSFEYPSTSLTVSLWSGLGLCCAVRAQNANGPSPFSNVEGFIIP